MTVKLKENIYWVGAIDWTLRDFHGYVTGRGATYNSYLIIDEKITLVDTVKEPFCSELLERIRSIVDPGKIDYIICNHIEKDHSGSLLACLKEFGDVKIFSTKMAQAGLEKYYGPGLPVETVKTGDSVKLGKKTVQFLEVPMLHWPDSMFSYVPEDKLLLSNDGFGQHIATSGRFDDDVAEYEVMFEARKYYANLLTHLAPLIQNALKKVTELGLEIDMIAPCHGIIWRKDPGKIIQAYNDWSLHKAKDKVSVIYDTMWKSTEIMAKGIVETITDAGFEVRLLKLRETHRSDVMAEILDSKGIFIGSPTIHRQLFPTVADLLCYMKGLKPQNKAAAAFGSFGWSGEAVQMISDDLKEIKLDVIEPGVRAKYLPDESEMKEVHALSRTMIEKIRAMG